MCDVSLRPSLLIHSRHYLRVADCPGEEDGVKVDVHQVVEVLRRDKEGGEGGGGPERTKGPKARLKAKVKHGQAKARQGKGKPGKGRKARQCKSQAAESEKKRSKGRAKGKRTLSTIEVAHFRLFVCE